MAKEKQTISAGDVGDVSSLFEEPKPKVRKKAKKAAAPVMGREVSEVADRVAKKVELAISIQQREASQLLSWLSDNGCLAFGALPKAIACIDQGSHRRAT